MITPAQFQQQRALKLPVTFAKKLLQTYQNMWGKNGSLCFNQFSLFTVMTTEPSLLGRPSILYFFPESLRYMKISHKEVRFPKGLWEGMALILLCPEVDLSSASCVMDIRVHLKKKKMCSYLPSTAGMLQWVLVWIETVHLPLSWDLHCVLLLLGTGCGLMEENFNLTALSSSWRSTDPRWNWNKMS